MFVWFFRWLRRFFVRFLRRFLRLRFLGVRRQLRRRSCCCRRFGRVEGRGWKWGVSIGKTGGERCSSYAWWGMIRHREVRLNQIEGWERSL